MVRWWLIMSTEGCGGITPSFRLASVGVSRRALGYEIAFCVRACNPALDDYELICIIRLAHSVATGLSGFFSPNRVAHPCSST